MLCILSSADLTQAGVALLAMDSSSRIHCDPQLPGESHDTPDNPDVFRLSIISAGGFEAHVLCAIGETVEDITYVIYLSLLGSGTAVAAVWASLMDQRQIVVTLEEVGPIQLWQRQPALVTLGYAINWHRRTRVLQLAHGARLVHLVTEPDVLTMRDHESADAADRRRKRGHGEEHEGSASSAARSSRPAIPATSAGRHTNGGEASQVGQDSQDSAAAMEQVSEQVARETHPLFVLLGQRNDDATILARRHVLFLAQRIQWLAYYEPWADYFWQRGLTTGEVRPLTVWSMEGAKRSGHDESARHELQWIISAYLCQPDPLALAAALPEAARQQRLPQTMEASGAGNCSVAQGTPVASAIDTLDTPSKQSDEEGAVA